MDVHTSSILQTKGGTKMKSKRITASLLALLSMALLPLQNPYAGSMTAQAADTTTSLAAPATTAQTSTTADTPFALSSALQSDGTLTTTFAYTGATAPTQRVELLVGKPGSKEVVFQGKLQSNKNQLNIPNLQADQTYTFNVKVTDVRTGKTSKVTKDSYSATDAWGGDFVIRAKQDSAGQRSAANLLLGTVYRNDSLVVSDSEVRSFLVTYESESNNAFASANTLIAGDDIYGRISSSSDTDYYKVTFSQTGVANFWLGQVPSNTDYDLYVYDQNFNQVASSLRASNNDEMITAKTVTAGQPYYIKVVGYNSTFDANNYYDLRVTNSATPASGADSYENNNSFEAATGVNKTGTYYGNIPYSTDTDYYRLSVPLRSSFKLDLSNIPTGTDYDVKVFDANQNLVDYSMYAGTTAESLSLSLNPGNYYVEVYPYTGSSASNYTLSLSTNTIPVILLPGIGGSQLNANGSLTWFNVWDALLVNAPLKHNLALAPACSGCSDVVQKYSDVSITVNDNNSGLDGITYLSQYQLDMAAYYRDFINDLKNTGYVPGVTLFGFPYDWRLDNRAHHNLLTSKISTALSASGASKVQLVAHSMGGLVAKDYLLSEPAQTAKVDQMITLGTPFLGAGMASKAVGFGGYNFGIPIVMDSTGEEIAKNSPAVYQLAPSAEYENQVRATLGRPTYRSYDIWGNPTDYTHAQLNAKYPNAALAGLLDTRHSQWDTSYPNVKQYHIVGDQVSTVTAYNYWVIKDILHWHYLEYVMAKGDGTVPFLSGSKPGSSSATMFYAGADHMGLVKDAATRAKTIRLLKGDASSSVNGIRTAANTASMTALTSTSLTSNDVSFNSLRVELANKKTGASEVVVFRADGSLDEENSTSSLMPKMARLEDGTYNLQFFINKFDNYDITVKSADGTQFIVAKYDLDDNGPNNRASYGQLTNTASTPLTIKQVSGVTSIYQGSNSITGQAIVAH
jgi:pimeloyl-ACP methyl ester carboxylesterase